MTTNFSAPIGIFDSGIGGLTVVSALQRRLPQENYIYLGDTARVPYGTKSPETVIRYSQLIAGYLRGQGIKLLVVACNTASAHAVEALRAAHPDLPIIGVVEPGAQAAAAASRSKRVAVLATEGTVKSRAYVRALESHGIADAVQQACPLFVPLAEEGWNEGEIAELVARRYLAELPAKGVDTAILGCTHYPLLQATVAKVLGPAIQLVDSAHSTAEAVAAVLSSGGIENRGAGGNTRYLLTDANTRFADVGARFLGKPLGEIELVDL